MKQFIVSRDTREQQGWTFAASASCGGTFSATLKTGDYTLVGFENSFVIERKGSLSEFSQNVFQPRFDRELDRLDGFRHAFLILEFTMNDIMGFPVGSGIPSFRWKYLRITPALLLKRFLEIQIQHPTLRVILAGKLGHEVALSLFKRITDNVEQKQ